MAKKLLYDGPGCLVTFETDETGVSIKFDGEVVVFLTQSRKTVSVWPEDIESKLGDPTGSWRVERRPIH